MHEGVALEPGEDAAADASPMPQRKVRKGSAKSDGTLSLPAVMLLFVAMRCEATILEPSLAFLAEGDSVASYEVGITQAHDSSRHAISPRVFIRRGGAFPTILAHIILAKHDPPCINNCLFRRIYASCNPVSP